MISEKKCRGKKILPRKYLGKKISYTEKKKPFVAYNPGKKIYISVGIYFTDIFTI